MNNNYGLSEKNLGIILKHLGEFPEIKEALIFGSRAMGREKPASDIDIALKGDVTFSILAQLKGDIENDSTFPYNLDVLDYNNISNQALKEHIDRVGMQIYKQ